MSDLATRAAEFLAEARQELAGLERQRRELHAERDAKLAAIKEEYAERDKGLDAQIRMVGRLETALQEPKPRGPYKQSSGGGKTYPPRQATVEAVLVAMRQLGRKASVTEIAEVATVDRSTVQKAVEFMRASGEIVLAGQEKRGPVMARVYSLEPGDKDESTDQGGWVPSEEKRGVVKAAVARLGGRGTTPVIAEEAGVSREVVRRTMQLLEDSGQVTVEIEPRYKTRVYTLTTNGDHSA